MANDEPILRGQDENAPFRAHVRVIVIVAIVVLVVGGVVYGLFAAFHGKQKGPTMPAPVPLAAPYRS
jgi:flagellar basal body-associated protein FliL